MQHQTTLRQPVSFSGIGLHSGRTVSMRLLPAEADTGIRFKRTNIKGKGAIVPARYDLVTDTRLGTTITNKYGVSVSTIEHLMAALYGAGLDNALIEIDAAEVPIMDGSSEPFMQPLEAAGLTRLSAPRRYIRILASVTAEEGQSFASVEPFEGEDYGSSLDVTINFPHKLINCQRAVYDFSPSHFRDSLSRARTFGFAHEVAYLQSQGLARGGSLENAIVVGEDRILNEGGLRYSDEFIRHKALDCVGDLFLAGHRIEGQFTFMRPGHGINNKLLRALFADPSAWCLVSADEQPAFATEAPAHFAAAI
jgi:UDP-3-O-[3-hydroxymyristoyl] N-acetylglucosamine deacetylase